MRIAILDDETAELQRVEKTLQEIPKHVEETWTLHTFTRSEDLLKKLRRETFDLLILDWQLPEMSGYALLRWTQEHLETPPPTIMITSRNSEHDIVQALKAGADDYVCKPFRPLELQARVLAVLRRYAPHGQGEKRSQVFGDLEFDEAEQVVRLDGAEVMLTEREYRLALCLFSNLGRLLSRDYLYEHFWPHEEVFSSRPLDTHVYRLRNKLGLTAERGWRLATIYGHGYRLEQVS